MTDELPVTGGCLCKVIRYRIGARPIVTRLCWCRVCQYFACGNASVNACFPSNALVVEGEMRDYRSVADSGNVMHRRFCPTCGTHLFSEADSRPHLVFVRAGTLDRSELIKPSMSIWTNSAPSWACIDSAIPSVPGQPPPAA
jgi:hypothetical protein